MILLPWTGLGNHGRETGTKSIRELEMDGIQDTIESGIGDNENCVGHPGVIHNSPDVVLVGVRVVFGLTSPSLPTCCFVINQLLIRPSSYQPTVDNRLSVIDS